VVVGLSSTSSFDFFFEVFFVFSDVGVLDFEVFSWPLRGCVPN